MVAITSSARISSGVDAGDVAAQDRDVAQGARGQVAAPGLVAQRLGRVQGHRPQALLGGQQLVEHPRRRLGVRAARPSIPPAIWSTGRPMSSVSCEVAGKIHGVSVAAATCSPASTKSRQRASHADLLAGLSRPKSAR